MGHLSSGRGVKPGVLAANRDDNNALSFANAINMAEASVTDITQPQSADLVYSFIPKRLHPHEIANVIASMLPANISAPAIQRELVVSVPPTIGAALNYAAATLNRVAAALC